MSSWLERRIEAIEHWLKPKTADDPSDLSRMILDDGRTLRAWVNDLYRAEMEKFRLVWIEKARENWAGRAAAEIRRVATTERLGDSVDPPGLPSPQVIEALSGLHPLVGMLAASLHHGSRLDFLARCGDPDWQFSRTAHGWLEMSLFSEDRKRLADALEALADLVPPDDHPFN